MAVILYHGTQQTEQSQVLSELLAKSRKPLVLTDGRADQNQVLSLLHAEHKAIFGTLVSTPSEFFFSEVKALFSGGHLADRLTALAFLSVALSDDVKNEIQSSSDVLPKLQSVLGFFLQIKRLGLPKAELKPTFFDKMGLSHLFASYTAYNDLLKAKRYFDEGDLTGQVLKALRKGKLKLRTEFSDLIFYNVYPFSPALREFLRLMKNEYPERTIHVLYPEDNETKRGYLELAFEDLGQIADHTVALSPSQPSDQVCTVFESPHAELQNVVNKISELPNLEGVSCVIPKDYLDLFLTLLARKEIPARVNISQKAALFQSDKPADSLSASKLQRLASDALQDLRDQKAFLTSLFALQGDEAKTSVFSRLLDEWQDNLSFTDSSSSHQLTVTSYDQLGKLQGHTHFFLGLQLESLRMPAESPLYKTDLNLNKQYAELLGFSAYQFQIGLSELKRCLSSTNTTLHLSRSLHDLAGKETTPLTLVPLDETRIAHKPSTSAKASHKKALKGVEKTQFGLTELQDYHNCPFVYEAKHVLELGEKEKEQIDPEAKWRGILIHRCLQEFIAENTNLFEASSPVDAETLKPKILSKLQTLAKENPLPEETLGSTQEIYLQKMAESIALTIVQDTEWNLTQKKQTRPQHFESSFRLKFDGFEVSGRIDRVDIDAATSEFSVIDYKSGSLPSAPEIKSLQDLQMATYLYAAETELFKGFKPSAGLYFNIKDQSLTKCVLENSSDSGLLRKNFWLKYDEWENIKDELKSLLPKIVAGIQSGEFSAAPRNPRNCQFCDYRRICGYYQEDIHAHS